MSEASAAPWAALFKEHLSAMSSPEFVLATVSDQVPHARYCIYRGMWASIPVNSKNPAPLNPPAWASDCPTFTTDQRMQKVGQLVASSIQPSAADAASDTTGGGPVEAVWWVKEKDIMAQWRIRGTAWSLGNEVESEEKGPSQIRARIQERMRAGEKPDAEGDWSWAREITAQFGNMSPGMRGTFKNPPPGAPKSKEPDSEHQLGQKVEDMDDKTARENFRVVVILPDQVERVELADPNKARRVLYQYDEKKKTWSEEEQWP